MKYPPPPPNEPRFKMGEESHLIFLQDDRFWMRLGNPTFCLARKSAYCIAIVGWQREAVKLAVAGDQAQAETAGANADAWLKLLEDLK